ASTLSRQLGVGDHGVKTDQRDARNLSLASCRLDLPSVHLKSPVARERWSRLMARQSMVTARTQLINTVRGYLRMHLVPVRGTAENFPKRVKEALVKTPEGLPDYIENVLNAITALSDQIASAESSLKRVAVSDETCQRLMGIPGIGALTSLAFVAVVDDPTRFPNASSLYSYVGLAPGEHSSGAKKRRQGNQGWSPDASSISHSSQSHVSPVSEDGLDDGLGGVGGASSREACGDYCHRAQVGGHHVGDVAGRNRLQSNADGSENEVADLERPDELEANTLAVVTTRGAVHFKCVLAIVAHPSDRNLCGIETAHTRLRNVGFADVMISLPSFQEGMEKCSLTGWPLHTRSSRSNPR
ncbi:MAG: transposase, partial [Myxococcota bacterium]